MTMLRRLWAWTILEEGSTRAVGLMRVGLAALTWNRWANDFLLFRNQHTNHIVIGFCLIVASTLMFFGVFSRLSTAATGAALLGVYFDVGYGDGVEQYTHHHAWLITISVCILALTPCGGSYSWDRYRAVNRASRLGNPIPEETGPLWATRILAAQVSIVYFWGAYEKCNPRFVDGTRMVHHYMFLYAGSDYPPRWMVEILHGQAIGTIVLEFGLAFLLWVPRFHRVLIPVAMMFHAILYYTLPVGPFSLTMWLLFLAYIPAQRVHNAMETIHGARA